jgi:hypothetical protein
MEGEGRERDGKEKKKKEEEGERRRREVMMDPYKAGVGRGLGTERRDSMVAV